MEYSTAFELWILFEYDFDVNITAPANHIVVGSGELVNPTAVYSSAEQNELAQEN
jgi:hypothetical protein